MIICKEFVFDSAHKVAHTNEEFVHGHTYKLQICLQGKVNEKGLVFDLQEMKEIVKSKVLDIVDHKSLNDVISQPTVENIIIWCWNQLQNDLPLYELKLWESSTIFAVYRGVE